MTLPLADVRILALTQLGAGPFTMTVLGDLGAEIIKIEDPTTHGDEARRVPPYTENNDSLYFQSLNRNALSMTLNLRLREGRAVFRQLAAVCDAVYANPRGDLPAKLGLDYRSLKDVNPRLVCCSLSGFGRTGPRAHEPAYDYLMQGLAGFMSLTGGPDAPPTKCGISIVDFAGGLMSAVGLLVAILRARSTGVGGDVDVSLLDTAIAMLNYLAVWKLNRGVEPQRLADSAHPSLVPSQNFATKDGYVVVMCMKEKFWHRLTECLGLEHLSHDSRFATFEGRLQHRAVLIPLLADAFRAKTTAETLALLRGHVPCAPVNTVGEALQEEQVRHRQMVISYEHPHFGQLHQVGCPVKIDDVQPRYGPASSLGADTATLLHRLLGMDDATIEALRAKEAI